MTDNACWDLFIQTGDPVFYLLYRALARSEAETRSA